MSITSPSKLTTVVSRTGVVTNIGTTSGAIIQAAMGSPGAIAQVLQPDILAAEKREPDGTYFQLVLTGFRTPLGSLAGTAGQNLNKAFVLQSPSLRDPATGELVIPWPQYPDRIAFWDDATATLTLRWIRGQEFAPVILYGLAILIGFVVLYLVLRAVGVNLSIFNPTNPNSPVGKTPLFGVPLWAWLAGIGAAVLIPYGEQRAATYESAAAKLNRAEHQIRGGR